MKPVVRNRQFEKHFHTRITPNKKLKNQFEIRLKMFLVGARGYPLDDHALVGKMAGRRSFSITGDVRVIYRETTTDIVFLDIGTHAQVYGD